MARRAWYCPDPGYVAIHPGDILAGYRVRRLLGRGGMGEVWAASAEDEVSPRDVAIKVLLASAATKPELVRRFEREARIASAIDSPHVCKLVRVAKADDGTHLLMFELLDGESLADRFAASNTYRSARWAPSSMMSCRASSRPMRRASFTGI